MKARYETRDTEHLTMRAYPGDRERMVQMRERLQAKHPDRLVRSADVIRLALDAAEREVPPMT